MSYQQALSDLKEQFGSKKLLTPAEVATVVPRCVKTVRQIINSADSPLPPKAVGKRVCVSIYDVARFLAADEADTPRPSTAPTAQAASPPRSRKASAPLDTSKAYRRPPPIGRLLTAFEKRIDELELRLQFERELLAELEKLSLSKRLKIKDAKKPPPRPRTQPF